MISLRLPENLENRLSHLATSTNRTKTFYVREALERHIEDMEDAYLADQAYTDLQQGKDELIGHDEFWNDLED